MAIKELEVNGVVRKVIGFPDKFFDSVDRETKAEYGYSHIVLSKNGELIAVP